MKKLLASASCVAILATGMAVAQEEGPWSISGTVALTSNYMFRGFSQTENDPALQAGVTLAHESGFYAGFWGSNVDFVGDSETNLETDFFVGYGGSLGEATTFDVNLTYYVYPGALSNTALDYVELIGGITHDFGFMTAGVKAAYSPEFFTYDTQSDDEAFWVAGNITVPVVEWLSVSGNVGYQWVDVENSTSFFNDHNDYLHYDIGLTASFEAFALDVRYVGTDYDDEGDDILGLQPDEEWVGTVTFAF